MTGQALLSEDGHIFHCPHCGHFEWNDALLDMNHHVARGDSVCTAQRLTADQLTYAVRRGDDLDTYIAQARKYGLDTDQIITAAKEHE